MVSEIVADPCGCLYAPDGARLKHCGRGQQRAYPYTGEPTMHVLKANGWVCRCPGLRPRQRHQQPMDCIPAEALAAWRRAHEDVRTSNRTARALMWMDLTFATAPTAALDGKELGW